MYTQFDVLIQFWRWNYQEMVGLRRSSQQATGRNQATGGSESCNWDAVGELRFVLVGFKAKPFSGELTFVDDFQAQHATPDHRKQEARGGASAMFQVSICFSVRCGSSVQREGEKETFGFAPRPTGSDRSGIWSDRSRCQKFLTTCLVRPRCIFLFLMTIDSKTWSIFSMQSSKACSWFETGKQRCEEEIRGGAERFDLASSLMLPSTAQNG